MQVEIKEISNQAVWEDFLKQCQEKTFLQSWSWGEFQKMSGEKIWRLGVYENHKTSDGEQLVGVAMVVKIRAKRGTFLFVPHGPVVKSEEFSPPAAEAGIKSEVLRALASELKKIAEKEKTSFVRISPIWAGTDENLKIFRELGFRDAPIHMHATLTWELDIRPSEEEILKGMRKTTRYLIRRAENNPDIKIVKSKNEEDLALFNEIYQKTVSRHNFVPFSQDYLKNEIRALRPSDEVIIFLGRYKEKTVSSAIIVFWQNFAFYHHGASLSEFNKFPVSYLLQWEAIKEAKLRGCEYYNFWGIAPDGSKNHPWAGLTLFKQGFGGGKKEYLKNQDLVLKKSYWITYFVERIRRMKRRL